jgi:hypothetical protein
MVLAGRWVLVAGYMARAQIVSPRDAGMTNGACHMNQGCACHGATAASSRRSFLAGLACAAVSPIGAHAQTGDSSADDARFMRMAIDEARKLIFHSAQ